jgi:hypothetical protein
VGNIAYYTSASVAKINTVADYLRVTEIDDDATTYGGALGSSDNLDGVLNPNGTDVEIVVVYLYNSNDILIAQGPDTSKSITLTLLNVGSTGAVITATNLGSPTALPAASVTGTLTAGTAWIKVTATAAQNNAIIVRPSTTVALPQVGGSNQDAYILIRQDTLSGIVIGDDDSGVAAPVAGDTVMHPSWSHAGSSIVFAMRAVAPNDKWNLYKLTYSGGAWQPIVRLTNNNMSVQANGRYTFTGDDSKVIFATYGDSPELYAVAADGSDNADTLATLATENKKISNGANGYWWWDAEWNKTTCATAGQQDRMLVSLADWDSTKPNKDGVEIYMLYGAKNAAGLFTESGSTLTQITRIGGDGNQYEWALQPSWSKDCSKIVFAAWTAGYGGEASKIGIYTIDLAAAGLPGGAPVDRTSTGVAETHKCDSTDCSKKSALFPTFTSGGTMISYMVDQTNSFDMTMLIQAAYDGTSFAANFFNGRNFDNYLEYILDGSTFAPQLMGQSSNNEFGLVQCDGASCPKSTNGNMFSYITQKTGTTDGKLSFLELGTVSTVTQNGGLMFYQGAVTAVIPPGALDSNELQLEVTAPAPATSDGNDLLVSTGEAREFFPNGITFTKDIRLIFHYCDADNGGLGDGFLDTVQDATCTGNGGTIDENKLRVYYWCEATGTGCAPVDSWILLNGSIDPVNNYITVAINHFSEYDVFALMRGLQAPPAWVPLELKDLHTYPNPWRADLSSGATFNSSADSTCTGNITVDIEIYDIRGKIVRRLPPSTGDCGVNKLAPAVLATWDGRNNSGSRVASGVYLYILKARDAVQNKTYKGKLSVVR